MIEAVSQRHTSGPALQHFVLLVQSQKDFSRVPGCCANAGSEFFRVAHSRIRTMRSSTSCWPMVRTGSAVVRQQGQRMNGMRLRSLPHQRRGASTTTATVGGTTTMFPADREAANPASSSTPWWVHYKTDRQHQQAGVWNETPLSMTEASALLARPPPPITTFSQQLRSLSSLATPVDINHINDPPPLFSNGTTTSSSAQLSTDTDPELLLAELGMKAEDIWDWAQRKPTPLRLADMYQYAANPDFRIRNAVFLHTELPIRVAQRAVDLLTLPFGLSDAKPIQQVACTFIRYLHILVTTPVPRTPEEEAHFTQLLQSLVLDRTSIPNAIAEGLEIWQTQEGSFTAADQPERYYQMEEALYRFFTARVGLRFLIEHHVLSSPKSTADHEALYNSTHMFDPDDHDRQDMVGGIQSHTDVAKEVRRVADLVRQQCTAEFGRPAPPIEIFDVECAPSGAVGGFTYVPHHLQYMVLELLKNSVRATLRHAAGSLEGEADLEPIRVVMVKGAEDVTIKIADKAGGIPRSKMSQVFRFAHSTTTSSESSATDVDSRQTSGAQLRGFGLPITRIYARYFGGELTLKSMEGYGLDAYLHLPRLGNAGEHLPARVRSSPGELDSLPSASSSSYGEFRGVRHYSTMNSAAATQDAEIRQDFFDLMQARQYKEVAGRP